MAFFSKDTARKAPTFKQMLDQEDDPKVAIDNYLVSLYTTLQSIHQDAEAALALTQVRKRECEENAAQIDRFESLAKKALAAGNEDDARVFVTKKQELEAQREELNQDFKEAQKTSDTLSDLHDEIAEHIEALKDRKEDLLLKLLEANARTQASGAADEQNQNARSALDAFKQIDDETTNLIDKAHALALLNEGKSLQLEQFEQKYAT
ncbi:PspA/IM30 family protein [Eggerthellaceae bacterium 3-80]|nr:hypothetical protein D7W09_02245 [bacterium D16-34]